MPKVTVDGLELEVPADARPMPSLFTHFWREIERRLGERKAARMLEAAE